MSKWYDITREHTKLLLGQIENPSCSKSPFMIEWNNYIDSCTRKTKKYVLWIYSNGKDIPIENNGWRLQRRILAEMCEWHSGIGKHSFYEINITSLSEGDKTFRFYAEYDEQELINSIVKTLGILIMCKSAEDFDSIFRNLKNKDNIYDWRTRLSAELSWQFIQTIKNLNMNTNAFLSIL